MRTVAEWQGKTDDSKVPASVKMRVLEAQFNKCALSGLEFKSGDKIEFDHITPLWLDGEHRETNLQAVLPAPHKKKTSTEASVRAKVNRVKKKHLGLDVKRKWGNSNLKKKIDGTVVAR